MNILMLLGSRFPPDRRVEREVIALTEAGHAVSVLCRRQGDEPPREIYRGLARVVRVSSGLYPLYSIWSFSTNFVHPFWKRELLLAAGVTGAQAIHVHDLGHARTGIRVARELGIPSVIDLHEYLPGQIAQTLWPKLSIRLNPLARWAYSLKRWEDYQRACLREAGAVITVSEEIRDLLAAESGVEAEKITTLHNVEPFSYFSSLPVDEIVRKRYENDFVLTYIGNLGPHRRVDLVLKALPEIAGQIPNVRFLLVGGDDPEYEKFLRSLSEKLGVAGRVEFIEAQPFEKVATYFRLSAIGLVPQGEGGNTGRTIPNKIFQYWVCGVPVVAGSARSLERLIGETGAGLVFESGSAESLARAVIRLALSRALREEMGSKGRAAAETKYNWDLEKNRLLSLYERLTKQPS